MRELFLAGLKRTFSFISPVSPIYQPEPLPQQYHPSLNIPPTNDTERLELKESFISLNKLSLVGDEPKNTKGKKEYDLWWILLVHLFCVIELFVLIITE